MENNKNNGLNIFLIVLMSVVLVLSIVSLAAPNLKASDVEGIVDSKLAVLSFPTAQEVADLVDIPEVVIPEIVIPEMPTAASPEVLDNDKIDDIYEATFENESIQLKADALTACEFDNEDFEDFLEDSIESFDVLKNFDSEDDLEEQEITVQNLGLEDEEDKLATVYQEFKIKYQLEDSYTNLKGVVTSTGTVTFDDDEFECSIEYSIK